jgi:hypothetical protein
VAELRGLSINKVLGLTTEDSPPGASNAASANGAEGPATRGAANGAPPAQEPAVAEEAAE